MGFVSDLRSSQKYEILAEKFFKDFIEIEHPNKEQRKYYDFALIFEQEKEILVEVKADFASVKTGNFAIEYECNGKESGITSTWADYYIIFSCERDSDEYTAYKIPTADLKEMCKEDKYKNMKGGSGWRSRFWLVPVSEFEKYKIE